MPQLFVLDEILPEVTIGPARLPRRQTGNSPQGMTVTLLADYTLKTRAWLPSAAIVALLAESGVTAAGARAALSRLSRRGALESTRNGRNTWYRLTDPAAFALAFGATEVVSFAMVAESWDETWTLVAYSVPQQNEAQRRALRGRLRWLGYAPLYDALWISPQGHPEAVAAVLSTIGVQTATVFRARQVELTELYDRSPLEAWDLPGITDQYQQFVDRWSPVAERIDTGEPTGAAALQTRTEIMESYRQFIMLDPRLPARLMPKDWLRTQARDIFVAVYDDLAETACEHVRQVVSQFVETEQPNLAAHTVTELQTGLHPLLKPPYN